MFAESRRFPSDRTLVAISVFVSLLLVSGTAAAFRVIDVRAADGSGYGYVDVHAGEACLTVTERQAIIAELQAGRAELVARGLLPEAPGPSPIVLLQWPVVRPAAHVQDPGVHGISAFVDHNLASPDALLDWNCGQRTYDLPGANHGGTDLFTWPFSWHKMDNDDAEITAGAPGVIIAKHDGFFDRSCGFGGGNWNAVYVEHDDGSVAWYGHMKRNSLTIRSVGERVAAGEYLGIVGSSGNGTGPHLHLEIHDAGWHLIDPYAGPCNIFNDESWWVEQPPYFDSAINAVRTHSAPPEWQDCPVPAITNEKDHFAAGELVYFITYYRDQQAGQVSEYEIFRPDGSRWLRWSGSMSNPPFYAASYWYWSWTLPAHAMEGWWTFRVSFEGMVAEHSFSVGETVGVPDSPARATGLDLHRAEPNPFNPATKIGFSLRAAGEVDLSIRDLRGRRVATLARGRREAGEHSVTWRGRRDDGRPASSGVYVVHLVAAREHLSRRLVLIR